MSKDVMKDIILNNVLNAYKNNEFYEYIKGIGDYKIVLKDSPTYNSNDMSLMQKGLNSFAENNLDIDLDKFINESLMQLLDSNDIQNIMTVLDFVLYYVKYQKKDNVFFNVNKDVIIPLLKNKLLLLKQEMINNKVNKYSDSSVWDIALNQCDLYEIRTGEKIL